MTTLVQFDFPFQGPFGKDLVEAMTELAESIKEEPGLQWKIWTENAETGEAGGIYYFDDDQSAKNYIEMHRARLAEFGIKDINAKMFQVNQVLTKITQGPID